MHSCLDCEFYKIYPGSHDRFGLQMEPDETECTSRFVTEDDIDTYYCDGKEWSGDEGCSGWKERIY